MELYPCAYLPNYLNRGFEDSLTDPVYDYYIEQAPVFVKGQARAKDAGKYLRKDKDKVSDILIN